MNAYLSMADLFYSTNFSAPIITSILIGYVAPIVPAFLPLSAADVTSTTITLRWLAPSGVNCGGECTGISYDLEVTAPGNITSVVPWTLLEYPYTSALPNQYFLFRIRSKSSHAKSLFSDYLTVHTPDLPPQVFADPTYTVLSYNTIMAQWYMNQSYFNTSSIDQYHFSLTPTASLHTAIPLDFYIPAAALPFAYAQQYTMSGFTPASNYTVEWEILNQYGWSGLRSYTNVTLSLPEAPPQIVQFIASDIYHTNTGFGAGSQFIVVFDKPAFDPNQLQLSVQANVDQLFRWSAPIPGTYAGVWSVDFTKVFITVSTVTQPLTADNIPTIGQFSCQLINSLTSIPNPDFSTSIDALTAPGITINATLTGSWNIGTLKYLRPQTSVWNVQEDTLDNLIPLAALLVVSNSSAFDSRPVQIQVQAVNGYISYQLAYFLANPYTTATRNTSVLVQNITLSKLLDPSLSPLLQFGYSAPTSYIGADNVYVTMTVDGRAEQVSLFVSVLRSNHPPVITVPSLAQPVDIYESIYLSNTLLNFTDPDNNYNSITSLTLFCSSSTTGRFAVTQFASAALSSTVSTGVSVAQLTLLGAMGDIQNTLPFITFSDPSMNADWPQPYVITVHVDDLGSNITGAVSLSAQSNLVLRPICPSAPAPVLLSAQFSTDLTRIKITFDSTIHVPGSAQPFYQSGYPLPAPLPPPPTNFFNNLLWVPPPPTPAYNISLCVNGTYRGNITWTTNFTVPCPSAVATTAVTSSSTTSFVPVVVPVYGCTDFLDISVINMLGAAGTFSCAFTSGNVLTVQLGYGYSISLGSTLLLNTTSTVFRRCSTSNNFASGSVQIIGPATIVQPVVVIQGPANVSLCADLSLTTTVLNSSGPMSYVWSSADLTIPSDQVSSSTLTLASALLNPGQSYTFSLFVVNLLNIRSNLTSFRVGKSSLPIPTLQLIGPSLVTLFRPSSAQISVAVNLSQCVSQLAASQQQVSFYWSIGPSGGLDPTTVATSSVIVPAYVLTPGNNYALSMTAWMTNQPTLINVVNLTLSVAISPLVVSIVGGVTQSYSSTQGIQLNGLMTDPDKITNDATIYVHTWTCQVVPSSGIVDPTFPVPCFDQQRQQPLNCSLYVQVSGVGSSTSSVLNLPGNTLAANTYIFSLAVAAALPLGKGKSGSSNVTVLVSADATAPQVLLFPSATTLNPYDPLIIRSNVLCNASAVCASSNVSYVWSLPSGSFAGFTNSSLTQGWSSATLQINTAVPVNVALRPVVFPAGAKLRFRLTATLSTGSVGYAEVDISITRPPVGGQFAITPATGIASSTSFFVSATGWTIASPSSTGSFVLSYHYFVQQPDGSLVAFGSSPGMASDVDYLFAGVAANNFAVTVWLCVADNFGVSTYVSRQVTVTLNPATSVAVSMAVQSNVLTQKISQLATSGNDDALMAFVAQQSTQDVLSIVPVALNLSSSFSATPSSSLANMSSSFDSFYISQVLNTTSNPDTNTIRCLTPFLSLTAAALASSPYSTLFQAVATRDVTLINSLIPLTTVTDFATNMQSCITVTNEASFLPLTYLVGTANLNALMSSCIALVPAAARSVNTLCTSAQSATCVANQQALLAAAYNAAASLLQLHQVSYSRQLTYSRPISYSSAQQLNAASGSSSSSNSLTPFVSGIANTSSLMLLDDYSIVQAIFSSVNTVLDNYIRMILTSPSTSYQFSDCQLPSIVRYDWSNKAVTMNFSLDGSSVWYSSQYFTQQNVSSSVPALASSVFSASAILVGTRATYALMNPFLWNGSASILPYRLISGVLSTSRTNGNSSVINVTYAQPSLIVSIRYDGFSCDPFCKACNYSICNSCNYTCLPVCMMLDPVSGQFTNDSRLSTSLRRVNNGTQFFADCTLAGVAGATLAVFAGPPINLTYVPPAISTDSSGTNSAGSASSSTGVDNGLAASSSSSSAGSNFAPSSTASNVITPNATNAIPITIIVGVIKLDIDFNDMLTRFSNDLNLFRAALVADISRATAVEASRFNVLQVWPGSVFANISVFPFTATLLTPTVTLSSFLTNITTQMTSHTGPFWSGQVTNATIYSTWANITWFLCSDGSIQPSCPVNAATSSSGGSSLMTWLPIAAGAGGGFLLLFILLLALCLYKRKRAKESDELDPDLDVKSDTSENTFDAIAPSALSAPYMLGLDPPSGRSSASAMPAKDGAINKRDLDAALGINLGLSMDDPKGLAKPLQQQANQLHMQNQKKLRDKQNPFDMPILLHESSVQVSKSPTVASTPVNQSNRPSTSFTPPGYTPQPGYTPYGGAPTPSAVTRPGSISAAAPAVVHVSADAFLSSADPARRGSYHGLYRDAPPTPGAATPAAGAEEYGARRDGAATPVSVVAAPSYIKGSQLQRSMLAAKPTVPKINAVHLAAMSSTSVAVSRGGTPISHSVPATQAATPHIFRAQSGAQTPNKPSMSGSASPVSGLPLVNPSRMLTSTNRPHANVQRGGQSPAGSSQASVRTASPSPRGAPVLPSSSQRTPSSVPSSPAAGSASKRPSFATPSKQTAGPAGSQNAAAPLPGTSTPPISSLSHFSTPRHSVSQPGSGSQQRHTGMHAPSSQHALPLPLGVKGVKRGSFSGKAPTVNPSSQTPGRGKPVSKQINPHQPAAQTPAQARASSAFTP